jgi:GTP cyclohydrolase II
MVPPSPLLKISAPVEFVAETLLPTRHGKFRVRAYRDHTDGSEPLAIISGEVAKCTEVLLRAHDQCLTSEVLGSLKCDCADQLDLALRAINETGQGVVLYLPQEGRGIGLANKIAAYRLQECGLDTVEANRELGLPDDLRRYDTAAAIIRDLKIQSIRLMTNNPRKLRHLVQHGVKISQRLPVQTQTNPHSENYVATKATRMGHALDARSLEEMLSSTGEDEQA